MLRQIGAVSSSDRNQILSNPEILHLFQYRLDRVESLGRFAVAGMNTPAIAWCALHRIKEVIRCYLA